MRSSIAALVAALCLSAPIAASAQVPSYADQAAYGGGDEQIRGRIVNFDGGYNLQVRDDRGYIDQVVLHPGTIINPTGLTLAPGMVVSILGFNAGSYFGANEVDTPYTYYGGVPYYGGHPWSYYGSGITLAFFFGSTGWWHGPAFRGAYYYNGGARVYTNVNVNVYHGGAYYHGPVYAAPIAHGGYYPSGGAQYHGGNYPPSSGYHGGNYPPSGGYHGGYPSGGAAYHSAGEAHAGGGEPHAGGGAQYGGGHGGGH